MTLPDTAGWRRLAGWTPVTGSVSALGKAIVPALAGGISAGMADAFIGLIVAAGVALLAGLAGLIPWLTTTYRVTDTHLEVRRGLLNRTTLTARLDRIRSVDLQASLIHRVVGVTRVNIGTGVDEVPISLDSLTKEAAARLRRELLHAAPAGAAEEAPPASEPEVIAKLDWSWIRFAPLNLRNLAIALGGLGAIFGFFANALPWDRIEPIEDRITALPFGDVVRGALIVVPLALIGGLAVWVVGSCIGYAVRWWGLQLVREAGRDGTTLRRTNGLTTTRSTTVEEAKVRGASSTVGPLIGLAGGADLTLLTTGLDDNNPAVLPTAPQAVVTAVARDILGDDSLRAPLTGHGPSPRRRYHLGAVRTALAVAFIAWALASAPIPGLARDWNAQGIALAVLAFALVAGVLSAELRYRHLGHGLTDHYLVARTGAYATVKTALQTEGIIGWRFTQGFFDRRLGLAQLTAMTAAGDERLVIPDIPVERAVSVAAAATPQTVSPFVTPR